MKEALCRCGHLRSAHLYEEGRCLPGFVCGSKCEEFRPEAIPNRLLKYMVMPEHRTKTPWGTPSRCKASYTPGYVHEIDHTHWRCNACGFTSEIPEEN